MALLEPGFTTAAKNTVRTVGLLAMDADPVISDAVRGALLASDFEIQPVVIPGLSEIIAASMTILDAQAWQTNKDLVAAAPDLIGNGVRERLREASLITGVQVTAAQATIASWKATLDDLWRQVDVLALPTLLGFPPFLEDAHTMFRIRGLTSPVNVAGLPALALPVPSAGPLPASLQLIGPANSEERLLAAGALIERAAPA
jgi:Asp-tRNA(Asn)/Glu-tRNA(Gln) amidotransferase A subunit family amidase